MGYHLILVVSVSHDSERAPGYTGIIQEQDYVLRCSQSPSVSAGFSGFSGPGTPLRDLMLDLCIMLLLKGSPRVEALIEFRKLLRSKDRKIATGGASTSADFLRRTRIRLERNFLPRKGFCFNSYGIMNGASLAEGNRVS